MNIGIIQTYQLVCQPVGALVVKTPLHSFLEFLLGLVVHINDKDSAHVPSHLNNGFNLNMFH